MRPVIAKKNCCTSVAVAFLLLNCTSCKPKSAEREVETSASVQSANVVQINQLWPAIKTATFGVLAEDFGVHLTVLSHLERSNTQIFEFFRKLPNFLQGERFGVSEIYYSDQFAKAVIISGHGVIDFSYYPVHKSSQILSNCYLVEIIDIFLPNLGVSWKSPAHFSAKWNSRGAVAPVPPKYVKQICFGIADPSIKG